MKKKVAEYLNRLAEVEIKISNPEIFSNSKEYSALSKEHSYLLELKNAYDKILNLEKVLADDKQALAIEKDPEMVVMLEEGINENKVELEKLNKILESLLVPPDPDDDLNVIMELRAGTGGEEAALFVGDCVRMYHLYASSKGWKYEVLSASESDLKGYKEYVMGISGTGVKRLLQYEAGTHRVQRVPETETQGRVHTSAITIAVLPEPSEEDTELLINEKDLKIDTFRASGAGGQHVNVTDSAVRITHLPTGVVVTCQDERSQHKNKDKAMRILKARIRDAEMQKRHNEASAMRSAQVGSGDRSERIRTYNFSQNRVTDHRIGLTLYNLDKVMEGDLDPITTAMVSHAYHQLLEHGN
ncbi:translation releasing factor RF-1 [Chlamydia pneumoniae TW-183]|uniref:Peptide chain release factor 1 n=3 Tax=Chlamydia pneumoniae TaxID=83558 RepID=RF1_CHLPN|nr:peptide chain release factor 1 [Chlamydia pneumoniae]Q9Z968.1 RecName: Full=Peptide chain release factor 1; Short=RF-1 [Chlamydia pneumoniae]AAD18266.1 Peptide Chain Releasing Factor [Chlamydia pneumoniae CWL029]AAF38472.1 peptide chain release factor 1 [Chlamydia pneumoniae AR39]AAP98047.1 translation releasing factor RF-1 [Chlamydia pneumoniae TW-183]ACZ33094.1 peptide chain release factor 1 [Chlamydia pneumoniae LPCoLN]ETR79998.1 Peptide chain release factor 1 [Chlamydia pneumoniae B21]